MKAPDGATKNELAKKAWDKWCAFLLFNGINKNKYGTLYNKICQQYTRGVNQHPHDTMVVINIFGDQKIDQKYYNIKKAKVEKQKNKNQTKKKFCTGCIVQAESICKKGDHLPLLWRERALRKQMSQKGRHRTKQMGDQDQSNQDRVYKSPTRRKW